MAAVRTRWSSILSAACLLLSVVQAWAQEIRLPQESARYVASDLPGYKRVQQNCLVCHSAEYVLNQPHDLGREYWDATVRKMKQPFGAFFADEDIAPMVDYLVKTYGAERQGADGSGQPKP